MSSSQLLLTRVFQRGRYTTNQHDYIVSHYGDSHYGMDDDWGPIHPMFHLTLAHIMDPIYLFVP